MPCLQYFICALHLKCLQHLKYASYLLHSCIKEVAMLHLFQKISAQAHISDNSAQKNFFSSAWQGLFCARANLRHKKKSSILWGLKPVFAATFALLAAMFLLVSCAEPSSSGPRKKTEAQALQALETATNELGKAITTEIAARKTYATASGGTITWRLLPAFYYWVKHHCKTQNKNGKLPETL